MFTDCLHSNKDEIKRHDSSFTNPDKILTPLGFLTDFENEQFDNFIAKMSDHTDINFNIEIVSIQSSSIDGSMKNQNIPENDSSINKDNSIK